MKYNYIYNCEIVNIYIYNKDNYINIKKKCIYIKKNIFYVLSNCNHIYIYSSLIIYIIVNINI